MGLLRSVHDDTPTHPKDDPAVMAKGREVEAARMALSAVEARSRALEKARDSHDELQVLDAAHALFDLRQQYIAAKADVLRAQRAYDEAFQHARGPWLQQARATYREAALTWLAWLENEALSANQAMVAAQEAAEQAGLHVDQLHCPQLLPEAIAHRCRVGRQGLDPA